MRFTLLAVVLGLVLAGCVEKRGPMSIGLGGGCANSCDCADPYSCVDGTCTFALLKSCTPDVKSCVGEFVGTCKSDGSAFELDVSACPHGCLHGACRTTYCEPATVLCVRDRELTCNQWGLGWDVTGTCATDGGAP